jgi:uncharacterized heparinase superfamily protein
LRAAQYWQYRHFPSLIGRWNTDGAFKRQLSQSQSSPSTVETLRRSVSGFNHLREGAGSCVNLEGLPENRFTFLNDTHALGEIDWDRRYVSHLWNYHLHYFEVALCCEEDERARRELSRLVASWIDNARIGVSDGWEPYPLSLRIVNWIYAYSSFSHLLERSFVDKWRSSIFQQARFLAHHIEFHLLANHLVKNLKALIVAGLFFSNKDWLEEGERLLWRELDEQVLDDGGHFERSTMYHAQVMADFLECYAVMDAFGRLEGGKRERLAAKLRSMSQFLSAMTHLDGSLALFNDSANTRATRSGPILEAARRMVDTKTEPVDDAIGSSSFPVSGYFTWTARDASEKIVVDGGPPSIDYNVAHAHCDMLSFELYLNGKPIVVDSGVHGYEGDRFREYSRSTRAHNTLVFDGREQSEIWGTFRVARRAKMIRADATSPNGAQWRFEGSYSPYYNSRLVHSRVIARDASGDWVITDRADGEFKKAESFIHLHPAVNVKRSGDVMVECDAGGERFTVEPFGSASTKVSDGWYFPDFGIAQRAITLSFQKNRSEEKSFGYRIKRGI